MNWLAIAGIMLDCLCLGLLIGLVIYKFKNRRK